MTSATPHPESAAWPSSSTVVEVPAHPDFVASIRAMTRAMAVLGDMTLDDVEELQMAVDEAAILLLPLVAPDGGQRMRASFDVEDGGLSITLAVCGVAGASVDRGGLPWMLLSALDPEAVVTVEGADLRIGLHRRRRGQLP